MLSGQHSAVYDGAAVYIFFSVVGSCFWNVIFKKLYVWCFCFLMNQTWLIFYQLLLLWLIDTLIFRIHSESNSCQYLSLKKKRYLVFYFHHVSLVTDMHQAYMNLDTLRSQQSVIQQPFNGLFLPKHRKQERIWKERRSKCSCNLIHLAHENLYMLYVLFVGGELIHAGLVETKWMYSCWFGGNKTSVYEIELYPSALLSQKFQCSVKKTSC